MSVVHWVPGLESLLESLESLESVVLSNRYTLIFIFYSRFFVLR